MRPTSRAWWVGAPTAAGFIQIGGSPSPAPSQKVLLLCVGAPAVLNRPSSAPQHGGV